MTGNVYLGEFEGAADGTMADLARNPSEFRDVLDSKITADVPAIVVTELGKAPTVEAAAAAAVNGKLAASDIPLGTDKRVLPGGPAGTTGWYEMDEASGYLYAFVVFEQRDWWIVCGITLEGYWKAHTEGDAGSGGGITRTVIRDAIPELWVGRPQTHMGTVFATANGERGAVLAVDFDERSAPEIAQVAIAPINDHNVGGRCTLPGRGTFLPFSFHGEDNLLRVVMAGGTGRAKTLTGRPVFTFPMGGTASYSHPWDLPHLRTTNTDTMWTYVRVSLKWCIREIVADWATNIPTATPGVKQLVEFPEQAYMDVVGAAWDDAGNVTKHGIIAGHNPLANSDNVWLLELDTKTGIMHDKANPGVTHDINSGAPLKSSALTPVLADKPTGTRRVCGLYTARGGRYWKFLTIEYPGSIGPDGVITLHTYDVQERRITETRALGITGRHLERYPGGAQFADDGTVWWVTEANDIYTLWYEGVIVRQSRRAMFRPMPVPAGGPYDVLIADVGSYTSYLSWSDTNYVAVKKGR